MYRLISRLFAWLIDNVPPLNWLKRGFDWYLRYYAAGAWDKTILLVSLVVAAGTMFVSLTQLNAYGSSIFVKAVGEKAHLWAALVAYSDQDPRGLAWLLGICLAVGGASAFVFFHPLLQQSKANFASFFDDGLKSINDLSYGLIQEELDGVDYVWLTGFIDKALSTLAAVTNAKFVVCSLVNDSGQPTVQFKAGWGGPPQGSLDFHSLHFLPEHDHFHSHSGQHALAQSGNGQHYSRPSLGAKIMHPYPPGLIGVLWLSIEAPEKFHPAIERLIKATANVISLALLKFMERAEIARLNAQVASLLPQPTPLWRPSDPLATHRDADSPQSPATAVQANIPRSPSGGSL